MKKLCYGLLLLWPIGLWLASKYEVQSVLLCFITIIFAGLLIFSFSKEKRSPLDGIKRGVLAIGTLLIGASALFKSSDLFKWYPVAVNLIMFMFFGLSLFFGKESIVTSFARLLKTEISNKEVIYTRKVTAAWCLFFLTNGLISVLTVVALSSFWWAVWNGFLSYLAVALMGASELAVRRRKLGKDRT